MRTAVAVGAVALVSGCFGHGHSGRSTPSPAANPLTVLAPTQPAILSPANATGQDEDPTILRAADGGLYLAWYSNRNGLQADGVEDKEIFVMRSVDGRNWSDPPVQATEHARYSFFPSLAQDTRNRLHLAWWRVIPTPEGCVPGVDCDGGTLNRVMYKSSADGLTWDRSAETTVADGPGDWLPSIVHDRVSDRLLIFFASVARDANGNTSLAELVNRLYVVVNDGTGWSAPRRLQGVNPGSTHNTFPHVVQRADGMFLMTWTRYEAGPIDPSQSLSERSTDTLWATSTDGVNWTLPTVVSDNDTLANIDVLPTLYQESTGNNWIVTWLTASDPTAGASSVEMRVGGSYPTDLGMRPELTGYSGHVVATATPGIYLGVWVSGAQNRQKIWYRYFSR